MSKRKTVATVAPAVENGTDAIELPRTTSGGPIVLFESPAARAARAEAKQKADRYILPDGSKPSREERKAEFEQAVCEAAASSRVDYALDRAELAKRFSVPREILDEEVAKRRVELEVEAERDAFLLDDEPWEEPVVGAELLDEIFGSIKRYITIPDHSATICSLWVLFAHCHDAFRISPQLFIYSPESSCGKSSLLRIVGGMCPRTLSVVSPSAAAVYHLCDRYSPTLILDEAEASSKLSELRELMNAGHERGAATVPRFLYGRLQKFRLWAPKALARIGTDGVQASQINRSILVQMNRRNKEERSQNERRPEDAREALLNVRRRCVRWANDNMELLKTAKPELPQELEDRAQDNWRPLFALADLCGVGAVARDIAVSINQSALEEHRGLGTMLLSDLRDLFDSTEEDQIPSQDIASYLLSREDRSWRSRLHSSNPASTIGRTLKVYSVWPDRFEPIESKKLTLDDGTRPQGYRREQFLFAWEHYLPPRVVAVEPSRASVEGPGKTKPDSHPARKKPSTRLDRPDSKKKARRK